MLPFGYSTMRGSVEPGGGGGCRSRQTLRAGASTANVAVKDRLTVCPRCSTR